MSNSVHEMESKSLSYHESMLRVCIDRLEPSGIGGRVLSMRLTRPIAFGDLHEFILEMEAVMDAQNYPQSFQRKRGFGPGREPTAAALEGALPLTQQQMDAAEGELATFLVQIVSRQYASWQGFIDWLDGSRTTFESELELAELIDQRLRPDAEEIGFA